MPGLLDDPTVMARNEPRIGSRSPLPQGGGGGLSQAAILQLLAQQRMRQLQMQQQQQGGGMGGLTANPLTNPQAILDAQMRAGGAS